VWLLQKSLLSSRGSAIRDSDLFKCLSRRDRLGPGAAAEGRIIRTEPHNPGKPFACRRWMAPAVFPAFRVYWGAGAGTARRRFLLTGCEPAVVFPPLATPCWKSILVPFYDHRPPPLLPRRLVSSSSRRFKSPGASVGAAPAADCRGVDRTLTIRIRCLRVFYYKERGETPFFFECGFCAWTGAARISAIASK
jgi:hypothetical protein